MMILTWRKATDGEGALYWRGCVNGVRWYRIRQRESTGRFELWFGPNGQAIFSSLCAAKQRAYDHCLVVWWLR